MKSKIMVLVFLSLITMACVSGLGVLIPIAKRSVILSATPGNALVQTVRVLQDLGYQITLVDKETGAISAEKKRVETPSGFQEVPLNVAVMISDDGAGGSTLTITVSTEQKKGRFERDSHVTEVARDAIISAMPWKK